MKKDGFTLIEILVVVILLGILITFTSVSVIKIRKNTLNDLYKNKIKYIETSASEWGSDNLNLLNNNSCHYINVGFLITNGYAVGDNDNKTELLNPLDNNSLNEKCICLKYTNIYDGEDISTVNYQVVAQYSDSTCSEE